MHSGLFVRSHDTGMVMARAKITKRARAVSRLRKLAHRTDIVETLTKMVRTLIQQGVELPCRRREFKLNNLKFRKPIKIGGIGGKNWLFCNQKLLFDLFYQEIKKRSVSMLAHEPADLLGVHDNATMA
jgi:hypothetical protein